MGFPAFSFRPKRNGIDGIFSHSSVILKKRKIAKARKIMQKNHLAEEKSPYLLQHAGNPVDWYPWGEEAFHRAEAEDKPIFLSIGYSTCHWCHVMAHESFENDKIAEILNQNYIAVKVDREERPDVDSVYMSVCQAMTGQGGWPLTIIMTPKCRPFFAGTYLPPKARYGMTGLDELLKMIADRWKNEKDRLLQAGDEILNFLKEQNKVSLQGEPDKKLVKEGFAQFLERFDPKYGGFGEAPKFPTPHNLLFLMEYAKKEKREEALKMVEKTLSQMYRGGIFDHVGGGFSRYSTDEKWLVPHFEKMLYDNALLAIAYLEAYTITGKDQYLFVAERTLQYVEAELTDEKGGFYCGQDADSDGVEGRYYVFDPDEIKEYLGEYDGEYFCSWFDITYHGNFEGKSIPNLIDNPRFEERNSRIAKINQVLTSIRRKRASLHKDDKILLSWNGLMIAAFAKAYAVTGEESYLKTALKAEQFITQKLVKGGKLLVRYRDGDSAGEGKIDDYAFYCYALLMLYRVTYRVEFLEKAISFAKDMTDQFFDMVNGGFYIYARDAQKLIVRSKEIYDGAVPSGNSVAAFVLYKLAQLTGEEKWQELFRKQIRFLAGNIADYPSAYSFTLLALMQVLYPSRELVCLEPSAKEIEELRRLGERDSNLAIVVKTKENAERLKKAAPFTEAYGIIPGKGKFYLCTQNRCQAPVDSLKEIADIL